MSGTPDIQDTSELAWFKSSYSSSGDGNDCVEIAIAPRAVHVRDSKTTDGPRFALSPESWTRFLPFASEG
ncbi:MAG: DUF397 domain-containing protein [Streptomyces sp.]|uniref:DUF397 domain-containing protein n=1 Tax=Streptomyces sp. TaxID=1931 RepID=UPI0025D8A30C|nr:DUF397 domain-containing protein [Streptomyces sp.]MBW8800330.1 DUF397 domain-containing protein [Streptomyces sp.]